MSTSNTEMIAVLRVTGDALHGFSDADMAAPESWRALVGKNGLPFLSRVLEDAVLVVATRNFETLDEFARHLRELLGATLDSHSDLRGIAVLEGAVLQEKQYDELMNRVDIRWVNPTAGEAVPNAAGWSFAEAAQAFATPGTRKRIDAAAQPQSAPEDDALEVAAQKFGAIFTAKNQRGELRRSLSAALDHSLDSSLLGSLVGSSPETEESTSPAVEAMRRGVASNPDAMNALEKEIRSVVDGGLDLSAATAATPENTEPLT